MGGFAYDGSVRQVLALTLALSACSCRPAPAVRCTSEVGIRITYTSSGLPVPERDGRYRLTVGDVVDLVVSAAGLPLTPSRLYEPSGLDRDVVAREQLTGFNLRLTARRPVEIVSYAFAFDDRGVEACRAFAHLTISAATADAGVDR